ncbi:hypothetical protein ACNI3Q_06930 [Sphingomonas sp. FW199]|uniref:hypothetical protein n=1 Tax=Sphingomonas sp. FW199 TaxID=3400217 RepID=UPI003CF1B7A9
MLDCYKFSGDAYDQCIEELKKLQKECEEGGENSVCPSIEVVARRPQVQSSPSPRGTDSGSGGGVASISTIRASILAQLKKELILQCAENKNQVNARIQSQSNSNILIRFPKKLGLPRAIYHQARVSRLNEHCKIWAIL